MARVVMKFRKGAMSMGENLASLPTDLKRPLEKNNAAMPATAAQRMDGFATNSEICRTGDVACRKYNASSAR